MAGKIQLFFIFVFLFLWMPFRAVEARAAEIIPPPISASLKTAGPASNTSMKEVKVKEAFDIFFILDNSGSMKKTDPQELRKAAAELVISLLGPEDHVGIISFGDAARTLVPLTPNLPANRRIFSDAIRKISSQELFTNLYEAVKKGVEEIRASSRSNKILLLFSDGQMDLGSKEKDESALKELKKLIPELVKANIKLYTVAFSEFSDQKLLNELAQETKGLFSLAKTDKDIHVIFASMFEQIKLPDTVPLEGNSFYIDKEIQEATVLITRQMETRTSLIDPNRKEFTNGQLPGNMEWVQTKAFDLITIKKPLPGRWKVRLSSKEGNKIFVVTDLSLKSSFNQNQVFQGAKINLEAWLERNNQRITEKRILEPIFIMADIREPNGNHVKFNLYPSEIGDKIDMKGIYSAPFTFRETGDYLVRIVTDGKTFKREQIRQVRALSRPIPAPAPSATKKKISPPNSDKIWVKAFIKLGFVNLFLLVVTLVFWSARKWNRKRTGRKDKEDHQEPNDQF